METMSDLISRLLAQYAQCGFSAGPLPHSLSIRDDLAVESLSLVSVLVDLGAELEVDITESGVELSRIQTVGDLVAIADRFLAVRRNEASVPGSNQQREQETPT